MKIVTLSLPELGLVVGTRAMVGVGIGLLLASRLDRSRREAIGATLAAVGMLTTIPLLIEGLYGGHVTEPQKALTPRPLAEIGTGC